MSLKLSTSDVAEILRRRASGQSPSEIGSSLGIPESLVAKLFDQIQEELLPNKKPSPKRYRLTESDRRKGGQASQLSRQQQRDDYAERISGLIDTRIKSVGLTSAYYWLRPGSDKEFSITLPNPETGFLFHASMTALGIPNDSIALSWRCRSSAEEQSLIKVHWGELAPLISFPIKGSSKSMRLSIAPFYAADGNGTFKVSSRGLAQAFLRAGQQMVINASGR